MADSYFHVQLTSILDVLLKTAAVDICALADSVFASLQREIERCSTENEELRRQLQSFRAEQKSLADTGTVPSNNSERDIRSVQDGIKRSHDCKQKAAERGIDTGIVTCGKQQKQSPASVGVKEELMELSVSQNLENRVDGVFSDEVAVIGSVVTERNAQLSDLSLELKAESEKNTTIIHNIQPDWNNCSLTDYEEGMENSLAVEGQNKNTQYIPYANSNGEAGDREQEKEQQLYDTYLQQTPDVQCTFIQIDGTVTASVPHNPEGQTGSSLICNLCGKRLSSERRLREHIKTHASLRPYTCPQCGKSFTRKASMNFHQNIHRGVKPYACDICPKSFADPSALRRHKSIHK